jgi:hypothetical protein
LTWQTKRDRIQKLRLAKHHEISKTGQPKAIEIFFNFKKLEADVDAIVFNSNGLEADVDVIVFNSKKLKADTLNLEN